MYYASPELSQKEWEAKREKQQKAMEARLKSLPQDNPIVKAALHEKDEMEDKMDRDQQWEIVDRLMSEARCYFIEEEKSFKESVKSLSEALKALVS